MSLPCGDSRLSFAQRQGAAAEEAALRHLLARGMALLDRNVRFPFGELDLVMRHQSTIVFVEVRFRSLSRFGPAALTVNQRKQAKIRRAAWAWFASRRDFHAASCRFDVVAMDGERISWIVNAF